MKAKPITHFDNLNIRKEIDFASIKIENLKDKVKDIVIDNYFDETIDSFNINSPYILKGSNLNGKSIVFDELWYSFTKKSDLNVIPDWTLPQDKPKHSNYISSILNKILEWTLPSSLIQNTNYLTSNFNVSECNFDHAQESVNLPYFTVDLSEPQNKISKPSFWYDILFANCQTAATIYEITEQFTEIPLSVLWDPLIYKIKGLLSEINWLMRRGSFLRKLISHSFKPNQRLVFRSRAGFHFKNLDDNSDSDNNNSSIFLTVIGLFFYHLTQLHNENRKNYYKTNRGST